MFSVTLETEPSEADLPVASTQPELVEEVDEFALSIDEDIFECFGVFDQNKTGFFDAKYLDKALGSLGIVLTPTELEDVQEIICKDGKVRFQLFQNYASEKMKDLDPFDALRFAFRAFDPDNEGIIPTDRFKKWMATLGSPLPDKEAKELAKMGDPANKGNILYEDLIGLLLS